MNVRCVLQLSLRSLCEDRLIIETGWALEGPSRVLMAAISVLLLA